LTRHVPVNIFIGSDNESKIKMIHDKFLALIDVLGFKFYHPQKKAQHFSERICVSKDEITISDVYEKFYSLYDAVNDKKFKCSELKKTLEEFLVES
jgi:hypothetical protein